MPLASQARDWSHVVGSVGCKNDSVGLAVGWSGGVQRKLGKCMLLLTKERWGAQAGQGFVSDEKVKAGKGCGLSASHLASSFLGCAAAWSRAQKLLGLALRTFLLSYLLRPRHTRGGTISIGLWSVGDFAPWGRNSGSGVELGFVVI